MISSRSGGATGTRKAFDLFLVWRWYSREIEADLLRYYRLDIRDWFHGELDSRRVLALLDGLPDESMFKTWAIRGGDWSEQQYIAARLVNEMALARADGKGYMPVLLKSPYQRAEDDAEDAWRREKHLDTLRELEGGDHGDHS